MARLILFNKSFGVLSQFSLPGPPQVDGALPRTPADYIDVPGVYPAGRLDKDSEGRRLLTADGALQQRIAHPRHARWKVYWLQVEGAPAEAHIHALRQGVLLKDGRTLPARVRLLPPPALWTRDPPVRERKTVPDSWLELAIREGRNRQVRRMTAAVGLPTLRLVRVAVGDWRLEGRMPGAYRVVAVPTPRAERAPRRDKPAQERGRSRGPRRRRR